MFRRAALLLGALWLAAAVVATGIGLLAVRLVAGQVGEPGAAALDGNAVDDALSDASTARVPSPTSASPPVGPTASTPRATAPPSARPQATVTTRPASRGPVRTFSTRGGTVSARCVAGSPQLVLATPAEGYRTKDSDDSRVRFESSASRITVRLSCAPDNVVKAAIREEREDDDDASPSPTASASPGESSEALSLDG